MHSRQSKRKAALQTMILPAKRCAIMKCRIDNDKGEKTSHTESTSIEFEQVSDDHVDSSEDSESPFGSKPASISPSLASLLRESGLSIYQQKLFDLGWDDLTFLSTRSEDELKKIATAVGMKTGHIAKFVFWISQKNR